MIRAGDILSALFDERFAAKAQGVTKLFSSWRAITGEQRIPAAADHSRIAELERNVILVAVDHPGWIQILQTKQQELLDSFQRRFPMLNIRGVSFCLSRTPLMQTDKAENEAQEVPVSEKFDKDASLKRIVERLERTLK